MNLSNPLAPGLVLRDLKRPEVVYRQLSWHKRALPNFIIIGAQKSGTTSLHHYLCQHPDIIKPNKKEVHYFDGGIRQNEDNYQKGLAWYRSHFPFKNKLGRGQLTFEASPLYLFHPLVPERVFRLLPKVKLIAILRNPVERSISHYFHSKRRGHEHRDLATALMEEEAIMDKALSSGDFSSSEFRHFTYKSRGLYAQQLEHYLEYFSRDQVFVSSSEELFSRPREILQEIYSFLGIDNHFEVEDLSVQNFGTGKEKVPEPVYHELQDFFREPNEQLYQLIGKRFDWG